MIPFVNLYKIVFEMTFLIIVGFLLRKTNVVDDRTNKGLSDILLKAVLPFSIILSANNNFTMSLAKAIFATAMAAILYYLLTLIVLNIIVKRVKCLTDKEKIVFVMTTVFANTSFFGFPLMNALYGSEGYLLAAVYNLVFNLFFYTYGVACFSRKKMTIFNLPINLVTASSVLAIALFFTQIRFPSLIANSFKSIGDMATPLSMIIVGINLTTVDIKRLFCDSKTLMVALLRTMVLPSLMFFAVFIVRMKFYMMPVTATTLVIMTALPSGLMNVVLSEKYDVAARFCTRNIFLSFLCVIITIPCFMYVCNLVFS